MKSRIFGKGGLVLATVVAAALMLASAALAAGQFTWTAHFNSSLRSRDYSTPNTGTHTIRAYMNCYNDTIARTYTIEVTRNRDFFPDVDYGAHSYNCGQTNTTSWGIGSSGTFHFTLRKRYVGGIYYDGNGTTFYP